MGKSKAHIIRKCRGCKIIKDLNEFCKNRTKTLGYDYLCKSCHSKQEKIRRQSNPDKYREINRQSTKRNSWKWKEMWSRYQKRYCKLYPRRHRANAILNYYVKTKSIKRPNICFNCNRSGKIEGHHCDYEKPLEIIWLCGICHKQTHRRVTNEQ